MTNSTSQALGRDEVAELDCGTGHDLPLIQEAVGAAARVLGVDLTDAMLAQARQRVERAGRRNVELVHSDAVAFAWPPRVDGVPSTFALTIAPEFDDGIRRAAAARAEAIPPSRIPPRRPGRRAPLHARTTPSRNVLTLADHPEPIGGARLTGSPSTPRCYVPSWGRLHRSSSPG